MVTKDISMFKQNLAEILRKTLHSDLNSTLKDEIKNEQNGDDVDEIISDRLQSVVLRLQKRDDFFIKKVSAALDRIKEGTFGICSDCGAHITFERLAARPMTTLCIDCKEEQEKDEMLIYSAKKNRSSIYPIYAKAL